MAIKIVAAASSILLAFSLSISQATARGFCNVDHFGEDEEARKVVAEAASSFYAGAGQVMAMLAHFETNDLGALSETAKAAEAEFLDSATGYQKAADQFSDLKLEGIDSKAVIAMALASNATEAGAVIAMAAEGRPAVLLAGCGDKAEDMAEASAKFQAEVAEQPRSESFSRILQSLTSALEYGRVVSAAFANASGEQPE